MKKTKAPIVPTSTQATSSNTTTKNTNLIKESNPLETLKALIYTTQDSNLLKIEFIKEELQADRYEAQSAQIAKKLMEYSLKTIEEPEMA